MFYNYKEYKELGTTSTKEIISVSRRTDIPAFYPEWFMNRVRAGYCIVANPFNAAQVSYVSLKPQDVIGFVFWTRNPRPLIKFLPELDKSNYKYYFQNTIIGYPREIDPSCPCVHTAVRTLKELSGLIGKKRVVWRYDPVVLSNKTSQAWHIRQVDFLMKTLHGYVRRLIISFIDPYRKTKIRMRKETSDSFELEPGAFDAQAYDEIAQYIGERARKYGLEVQSCAESIDLERYGITHGKCVDETLFGARAQSSRALKKDPAQREACGCVVSKDIGVNNSCLFGCVYCYATGSLEAALKNFKRHGNSGESLCAVTKRSVWDDRDGR